MNDAPKVSVPFFQQIATMKWNFWICNIIEAFERLAFFGVRAVLPIYMFGADSILGLTMTEKGIIYGIWAFIQCIVPMVSGGYTEAYGYKKSMSVAFVTNICGYALMANSAGFWSMLAAACLVGTGTAIFKPPVQGSVAKSLNEGNSGLGFGLFYWMVNVGGFFAPLIASAVRGNELNPTWDYVFYGAAIVTAVNFIPALFLFREPELDPEARKKKPIEVFKDTMGILWGDQPMLRFLLIISGFWFMFMLLWDLLPNFINEWVNTFDCVAYLPFVESATTWIPGVSEGWTESFLKADGSVKPELLINIDSLTILLLVIPLSWFFSRFKMMTSLVIGMLIGLVGFVCSGLFMAGTMVAVMIFVFAIGEIICSPKFSEYIGMSAPSDKKAIYMGYSNIPFAIGWGFGNTFSGPLYDNLASRTELARTFLVEKLGMVEEFVMEVPARLVMNVMTAKMDGRSNKVIEATATAVKEELTRIDGLLESEEITKDASVEMVKAALKPLEDLSPETSVIDATTRLWDVYHPWIIWIILGSVGFVSVVGMWISYKRSLKAPDPTGS
jgi:proton-dependent oligopeptide transporter, POT family